MVAIVDTAGVKVVEYLYDAWGRLLETSGTKAADLGLHNPLRYRGYVYDTESGLYYLQSRYYNPTLGRFLSSDVIYDTDAGLQGYDLFVYCGNNPVNRIDVTGANSQDLIDGDKEKETQLAEGGAAHSHTPVGNSGTTLSSGRGGGNSSSQSGGTTNPLEGIVYTPKVLNQMTQDDNHGFPAIVDNYGAEGTTNTTTGGDGKAYTTTLIPGFYKGSNGFFEYIVDSNKVCNHRFFRKVK